MVLYHQLTEFEFLSACRDSHDLVRFVAKAVSVPESESFIVGCPEEEIHHCNSPHISVCMDLAEVHGTISNGDYVELVGLITSAEPIELTQCYIIRNMNGLDYSQYMDSISYVQNHL